MEAALQLIQKVALLLFLLSSMVAMGMSIAPRAALLPLRNVKFVALALLLNFAFAPALSWAIAAGLRLSPGHAAGLMLLGCAAGAPFLPKLVDVARADLTSAAALMILLTAGTIVFMPVALPLLVPQLRSDAWAIARPLLLLIVAPLVAGMFLRAAAAPFSSRAGPILAKIGNLALLVLFILLVGLNVPILLGVLGSRAILAAVLHFFALFVAGWSLARVMQPGRAVLALGSAARNFGAALVPAASASGSPDITVMLIVSAIIGLLVAFLTARWARGR